MPPFAPGEYPALLTAACVAIYGCVPETDTVPTIAAMAVGLAAVELLTRTPSAPAVWALATALVLWVGLDGASGRASAVVGAWFAFWPIVLVTAGWLVGRLPLAQRLVVGLIGTVAAVTVARTGALEPTVSPAWTAVAVAAPTSALAAAAVVTWMRRAGRPARRPAPRRTT